MIDRQIINLWFNDEIDSTSFDTNPKSPRYKIVDLETKYESMPDESKQFKPKTKLEEIREEQRNRSYNRKFKRKVKK